MRCVTRANAETRAAKREPAGSMLSATLSATRSSVSVLQTSLETLRLNAFGYHPPATAPRTVPNRCNARTASVCLLATPTRTVPSMSAVCRDSACVSHYSGIMRHNSHTFISLMLNADVHPAPELQLPSTESIYSDQFIYLFEFVN